MIAKFQIEYLESSEGEAYVIGKAIPGDVKFHLTDDSYLDIYPIQNWLTMPRAIDQNGNLRMDLYVFYLKNKNDVKNIKVNDVLELWDDYVEVVEAFKIHNELMIAFLKCFPGKYEEAFILEDNVKKQWILKRYMVATGSFESYEKTKKEESGNIFQYKIEPVGHNEKPVVGSKLRIYRK